jgi:hydroxymethylglutaryl-CoA reductase
MSEQSTEQSRETKFYELSPSERLKSLADDLDVTPAELIGLNPGTGLTLEMADAMIENAVGVFGLPLGIAQHFRVNGREVLVPMAIEEPSVIAAASFGAKLAAAGGGFSAQTESAEMTGQMQLLGVSDAPSARALILENKAGLLGEAGEWLSSLVAHGGGPRDLSVEIIDSSPVGPFLVVDWIVDVAEAMGANTLNTMLERMAPRVEALTGGRVLLRILSNYADRRLARARCTVPLNVLTSEGYEPQRVRDGIIAAWAFAVSDVHRAVTHNKGIMNGVDAVVLATGNDWRAVEAGAHAYAARGGRYTSLSTWGVDAGGNLVGTLEMPMAVGMVGGATQSHPTARLSLRILGVQSARELGEVIVSVGLAQNLAALRALATEGIQRGHMALHARQVAMAAGAQGEEIERLAAALGKDGHVSLTHAREILNSWREHGKSDRE